MEDLNTISEKLDQINESVDRGSAESANMLNEANFELESAKAEDIPNKLAKITATVQQINEKIQSLEDSGNYLNELPVKIEGLIREQVSDASERSKITNKIKQKLHLLSLKIKKTLLNIKLGLTKLKRGMLLLAAEGKIAPFLQAMFMAIITAIQLIFKVIAVIIGVLNNIIKMIPMMFNMDAEGMAFFMTPKSFSTTKMNIMNPNQSAQRILPKGVITSIDTLMNAPLFTMGTNKKAAVAASVAQSAANAFNEDSNFTVVDADISYAVRKSILSTINTLLAILPLVEPLPKYERLPMWKNLGYFLWLLTGWCPAGKKSFGIPGM